ncbi:SMI1/KNR4 family protein [Actinophytocola sediminis]
MEREEFDWARVETSVGLVLPGEYKEIVEFFPSGYFQGFVQLIRPGDFEASRDGYLGYYTHRLEDMRGWREGEPKRFPFAIFPEPGGLLPCARSIRSDLFFWLTSAADPNDWKIVAADSEFDAWISFDGGLCDFLVEVVTGRFDGEPLGAQIPMRTPFFEVIESNAPRQPHSPVGNYWLERGNRELATTSAAQLSKLIGPAEGIVPETDWRAVTERLRFDLPSDYRDFIDTYGAGRFGDITIAGPAGAGNLLDLTGKTLAQAVANPRRTCPPHPPIYPEPDGMITWGETPDGWTCNWARSSGDPDHWGIVLLPPSLLNSAYTPGLSFSSFLVGYATARETLGLFLGRTRTPPDPVEFVPDR